MNIMEFEIMDSSYDELVWVAYKTETIKSYLLLPIQSTDEEIKKEIENFVRNTKLIDLSLCSCKLKTLVAELVQTDNDMLFIDHNNYWKLTENDIAKIDEELFKLFPNDSGVFGCYTTGEDGCLMTLYSSFQSYFNMKSEL